LVELRREGVPLQRVRKALRSLDKVLPGIIARRGIGRLAVTSTGEVVRVKSDRDLLDLAKRPGQTGWLAMLDVSSYVQEARSALAEVV